MQDRKNFLMQHLAKYLTEEEISFGLLASGKSSRCFKRKTSFKARTVHGHLYFLQNYLSDQQTYHDTPHQNLDK
jgi:hypothetical protein